MVTSVFCYSLATVALKHGYRQLVVLGILAAMLLGAVFIALEIQDFATLYAQGARPQVSGFLSAYFVLIATHGIHMAFGLLWLLVMLLQVIRLGLTAPVVAQLLNLRLFWQFQSAVLGLRLCLRLPQRGHLMSEPETSPILHGEVQQGQPARLRRRVPCHAAPARRRAAADAIPCHAPGLRPGSISGLAIIALLCQTFLSFGLDITRHNIWKSVSLVLTIPLFILTIGLTVWMFQQLAINTMVNMPPGANIMPGNTMQPTMLQ